MTDTRAPHATCGGDLSVSKFGELTQKCLNFTLKRQIGAPKNV